MTDSASASAPAPSLPQIETITQLFARDPMTYSKPDFARVVAALRDQRQRLMAAEAQGMKPAIAKRKAAAGLDRISGTKGPDVDVADLFD